MLINNINISVMNKFSNIVDNTFFIGKFSKFFKISFISSFIKNNRFINFNGLLLGFRKNFLNKKTTGAVFNFYKNYLMFYKIISIIKYISLYGGSFLFINTQFLLYALVSLMLKNCSNVYYMVYFKWINGTLSNYNQAK